MTNEMAVIILESLYPGVKEREPSNMKEQAIQKAIIALEGLAKDIATERLIWKKLTRRSSSKRMSEIL